MMRWTAATSAQARRVATRIIRRANRRLTIALGRTYRGNERRWASIQLRGIRFGHRAFHPTPIARAVAGFAAVAVLIFGAWLLAPSVQATIGDQFDDSRLAALRTVFVTIGGALIGATAVTLSIVVVAVQLNFARLPHALFRKVSSDKRLLLEFALTFLCGLVIALLSLIPDKSAVGGSVTAATGLLVLTLVTFLDAYTRALRLVSPIYQLHSVVQQTRRDLYRWDSRARRLRPLFELRDDRVEKSHDWPRYRFFAGNAGWDYEARQAVLHAISFASRYAREREYDVSGAALKALVAINGLYIRVRGKTFFASDPFFNTGLGDESFITFVLEELRKFSSAAITSGDEELLRQLMGTLSTLGMVYAEIDYGGKRNVSLHHTQLAAGYLTSLVELCAPKAAPDLLMEGARQIGRCAKTLVNHGHSAHIVTLADKLAALGTIGVVQTNFRPVTQVVVRELSDLTLLMLTSNEHDTGFATKRARSAIASVTFAGLTVEESPLSREHENLVSPYYSMTEHDTFAERFTDLVNRVATSQSDDDAVRPAMRHISEWADELYDPQKRVFLAAVKTRSSLTL